MSRKTRKLIWSAPLVAVLAVALAIFAALSPNWAQAHEGNTDADPPGPVNGLTAGADGYNAIVLKWDPPSSDDGGAPTGYRIDISEMPSDSHVWQFHETIGVNVSGAKHTYTDRMDLSAGNQRRYRVTGFNDAGVGSTSILPSSIVGATAPPTVPGPVIRLRARSGTGDDVGSILLSWTEPTDTGGEDIAVYCIVASTDRTEVVDQEPSTDNCDDDADVPEMDPHSGTDDAHTIAVSGKSTAYKHSGTFDGSTGDDPTPPVTDLTAGDTWYYRAYGANSEGHSTIASNIDDARVATGARASTVGAPMDLRVVWNNENTDATAYWNWPAGHTGTDFDLQRSTNSGFPTGTETTTQDVTIEDLTDLPQAIPPGETVDDERIIYYRVRAGADGRWSSTALRPSEMDAADDNSVTITNPNPRPVIHITNDTATADVDETPTAVAAEGEDGYTVIELTWTPDLVAADDSEIGRPSGYEIDRRTGADGPWQRLQSDTTYTSSEYSDSGLTPGTMYTYRIFPLYSSVRLGGKSMPVYGAPVEVDAMTREPSSPDPVRGLTVTADGPTAFNLEWDRVTETGGADVKFYLVQVVDDGDKDLVIDVEADATTAPLWAEANEDGKGRTDATTTEYRYEPTGTSALRGGDVRWFRVFAINQANSAAAGDEDDLLDDTVTDTELDKGAAEPKRGQTDDAAAPDPPVNLSAETARDSSGMEVPDRGVLLIWNMPDDPKGATIAHYVVERKIDDGEWEELGKTSDGSPDDRTYFNDRDKQVAGELRTYRVAAVSDTDAQGGWSNEAGLMDGQASHSHNTAPMAGDVIADQTVTAGQSVMVQSTITDADMGDTLMWSVMSSMEMYATAEVDNMGMVTITGVSAGMATVTVTATDAAGVMATQAIMVTVEAVDTTPMAPTGVMATVDDSDPGSTGVTVTWTDGENVEAYGVILFTSDFSKWPYITRGMNGSHTFSNVAAGAYVAVVVALNADGTLLTDANGAYLFGPANAVTIGQ